jgi:hypothetical protein
LEEVDQAGIPEVLEKVDTAPITVAAGAQNLNTTLQSTEPSFGAATTPLSVKLPF